MAVVPLTRMASEARDNRLTIEAESPSWARLAAAGGLLAGGLLLLAGKKHAGLVTAAGGAALALLDQKETVLELWNAVPSYIDSAQRALTRVEETVLELAEQRERLHRILSR